MDALAAGRCRLPFDVLGLHPLEPRGWTLRVFIPWARSVSVVRKTAKPTVMERVGESGLFVASFPRVTKHFRYRLSVEDPAGQVWEIDDPYSFGPAADET